ATREQLSALFQTQPAPPEAPPQALPQTPRPSSRQVDWLADSPVDEQPPGIVATQGPPDWQRVATALALRQRLTVISGGPGTGKTTTVVNLLACLIAQNPDCRIALAAPTGKAAARMTEAIRSRSAHLPPAIRDRLPADSFTIHRLLGVRPDGFIHHAGKRLAIDALVVDEASMLDLALATQLLEAVPETARIILLGDKDQLSAVEAGAVFSDLSADPTLSDDCRNDIAPLCGIHAAQIVSPEAIRSSALRNTATWLRRNFRFAADSSIARLAADINGARPTRAIASLTRGAGGGGGGDGSVRWLDDGAAAPGQATLDRMLQAYDPYLEAVRRDPQDASAITEAFGKFRVLCAVHEGPRGVVSLNEQMARHAREALAAVPQAQRTDPRDPWYLGRPVMVLRNDHVLKLFNGDIGISLPNDQGELMVYFADVTGGLRAVAPVRLPVHQTAFAMTVHKSQGSEFDEVLVLLPAQRSRVVSRELLYTAVTRARHRVSICASAEVLTAAIQSPTRRQAGLLDRLREAGLETKEGPPNALEPE
ncbi:MAG: exodeoxyribonuclease V subunit alpha, partial [Betaproteobacteria bacterium]|nr:exodeoxyribonuclease V subunit alpha [Betaproteobacteria bacterium]